jgi:hypothetical protein
MCFLKWPDWDKDKPVPYFKGDGKGNILLYVAEASWKQEINILERCRGG